MSKTFRPIIIFFAYFGVNFDHKNSSKLKRLILLSFRFKSFLSLVLLVVQSLYIYIYPETIFENVKFNLFVLSYHLKTVFVFILFMITSFKRKKINEILLTIEENIGCREKKSVNRLTKWLIILSIITVLFDTVLFLTVINLANIKTSVFQYFIDILWKVEGVATLYLTYSIVHSICYGIRLIEKNAFDQIDRDYKNVFIKEEFYRKLIFILNLKKQVNDHLGHMPMIWFVNTFSSTCLRLSHLSIQKEHISDPCKLIQYFSEYFSIELFSLSYLIMINYYQSKIPTIEEIILKYNLNDKQPTKIIVIKAYCKFCYKTLNGFTINKTFVFSLLSTVVTFTVMLVQFVQ